MTDFVSSRGDFSGWKGQTDRRRNFMDRLVNCIRKNVNKAFAATLLMDDYNAVNLDFMLEEAIGRPYAVCGKQVAWLVEQWARRKGVKSPVLYFFEDGARDKGDFQRWAKLAEQKPLFLQKPMGIPFQAADLYAWKLRNALENSTALDHNYQKGKRLIDSIAALREIPHDGGVWNHYSLTVFSRLFGVPPRQAGSVAPSIQEITRKQ